MSVVYHSNFVVWFEVGRVEMLRQMGFTYSEMEKQDGTHIAVVDMRSRYKAPARYDDMVTIRTRLVNVRDSLLHFAYEVVRDEDGIMLAEGETVHLVVVAVARGPGPKGRARTSWSCTRAWTCPRCCCGPTETS